MRLRETVVHPPAGEAADAAAPYGVVAQGLLIALADGVFTALWALWWQMGVGRSFSDGAGVIGDSAFFLSWTFLPCVAIALVVLAVAYRLSRGRRPWARAAIAAGATLVAPVLWSTAFCYHYEEFDYLPKSAVISEAAWIATLQPLWALFGAHVVAQARARDAAARPR